MAKITKYALIGCMLLIGLSCARSNKEYSNAEMIDLAETYKEQFDKHEMSCVELRTNYYMCFYQDSSVYIVSFDSKVIREDNGTIISSNAKYDPNLPNNFRELLSIVQSIYSHEIRYVSVQSDSIFLERFDGYYLSNIKPYDCSAFEVVQDKWYIKAKEK